MASIVNAKKFVKHWHGRGNEKQDTQTFWNEFFYEVIEIKDHYDFARYEKPVYVDGRFNGNKVNPDVPASQMQMNFEGAPSKNKSTQKYIDVYLKSAKTLIEQKSFGKNLDKAEQQSDGMELTPVMQAKRYEANLPPSERIRYIITCNFNEFRIYDLEQQGDLFFSDYTKVTLEELPQQLSVFRFLKQEIEQELKREEELSGKAVEKLHKLRDELLKLYELFELKRQDLTKLLIRLLFCLFAEDIGVFEKDQFLEYLKNKKPGQETGEFRDALLKLFKVLNTPQNERDKLMPAELKAFHYVNGGLFEGEIDIPFFSVNARYILLFDCAQDFNWSKINPTIFGSLFESMLQSSARREGGMHYTSPENIHKVTNPLFLEGLYKDYLKAGNSKTKLLELQNKLASLKIFERITTKLIRLTGVLPFGVSRGVLGCRIA